MINSIELNKFDPSDVELLGALGIAEIPTDLITGISCDCGRVVLRTKNSDRATTADIIVTFQDEGSFWEIRLKNSDGMVAVVRPNTAGTLSSFWKDILLVKDGNLSMRSFTIMVSSNEVVATDEEDLDFFFKMTLTPFTGLLGQTFYCGCTVLRNFVRIDVSVTCVPSKNWELVLTSPDGVEMATLLSDPELELSLSDIWPTVEKAAFGDWASHDVVQMTARAVETARKNG